MSKIKRHYFFPWQEEKEKSFLEKMATEGYCLTSVRTGKYTFESCTPRDLVYEIDFKGLDFDDVDDYVQIHDDAGWQVAASNGSWFYFCREKSDDVNNSLFNNNTSKLEKYRRLLGYIGSLWAVTVFHLFISISFSVREQTAMSNLSQHLLTGTAFLIPGILFFLVWLKYHHLKSFIEE